MTDLLRTQLQAALGTAYSLQGELGGGGMSRVFVARDLALHRDVVVKVLAPELAQGMSVERFAREVRLVAALQEPHIVPVLSAGVTAEGLPYYTMPFVEGENLRMRIMHAPVSRAEAVGVLRNIAQALSYAHAHGIVHRDIKPENVLLSSGTAVVTDFGIAKALSVSKAQAPDGPADATLTTFGASLGTPAYMAPEQAAGDDVDARADIYAWGVVAYELIAGQHPFAGRKTAQQLIAAHIAESPPPLPAAVPAALATLVMRCLAKSAASRPDSAAELVKLLDAATAGSPQVPAARRWLRALAVVTLALLMIVLGGWYGVLSPADRATLGVLARRKPVELRVNRIVVAPFRNETGDAALAALGPLAADVLTSGLSSLPDLEVVDARTAAASGEVARQIPRLFRRGSDELALADEVGAGVVIDGSYYRDGDSVRVRSRVLDAASGAIRKALPEVAVVPTAPAAGLGRLAERTVAFFKGVSNRDLPVVDLREFDVPKSLPAAEAWMTAYSLYARDDTNALASVDRVVALDTGWASAYAYRAFFIADLLGPRGASRIDSAVESAEQRAGRMTSTARALLAGAIATQRGDASGYLIAAKSFLDVMPASMVGRYFVSSAALWARQPRLTLEMLRDIDPDRGIAVPLAEWHWEEAGMAAAQLADWAGARQAVAEMHRRLPQSVRAWHLELALAGARGDTVALVAAYQHASNARGADALMRSGTALALLASRAGRPLDARSLAQRWLAAPTVSADEPSVNALGNGAALAAIAQDWTGMLARTDGAVWSSSLRRAVWTDSLEWMCARAIALAHAGRESEARALDASIAAYEHRSMGAGIPLLVRARIAAHLGETATAVGLAERAVAQGALRYLYGLDTVDSDPYLLPLREDARFIALSRPVSR